MSIIELSTRIAAPVERCFDLARSVDLHLHSNTATGEQAVRGITTGLLGADEEVTWRARHFGTWRELTSRMTVFDPPGHFRDSMACGPFKRFDHDHFFTPEGEGTLMVDRYDFELGYGPVGRWIDELLLRPHFARFLARRNRALKEVAESDEWRNFLPAGRGLYRERTTPNGRVSPGSATSQRQ
jgi:ligand-binding SRPBCC domain-containing protein